MYASMWCALPLGGVPCRHLFVVTATGMNMVVGSHDIHVGKLLASEDETRAAEIRAMADIIENRRRGER